MWTTERPRRARARSDLSEAGKKHVDAKGPRSGSFHQAILAVVQPEQHRDAQDLPVALQREGVVEEE